jgi:hypothetical protein
VTPIDNYYRLKRLLAIVLRVDVDYRAELHRITALLVEEIVLLKKH